MWEVTRAKADSPEYHRKLGKGWEPFSVIRETWQDGGRTIIWFRRQQPAIGDTAGSGLVHQTCAI